MRGYSYQAIFRYHSGLRLDIQRVMFIHSHKIETLEQTRQLTQDIKASLGFSSEGRVNPKAREQLNPNNHATRDPKRKSVVGESSRNTKGGQCFKCQGYGHVAARYPSRNLLVSKSMMRSRQ